MLGSLMAVAACGRLEVVALLIVLYPGTWYGKGAESS